MENPKKMKWFFGGLIGFVAIVLGSFFLNRNAAPEQANGEQAQRPQKKLANSQKIAPVLSTFNKNNKLEGKIEKAVENVSSEDIIILSEDNFEESISKCFQGMPCEFGEHPWSIYQKFKRSQHPRVCDSVIALMRKKLEEPEFREKYKIALLTMIQDFYSPQELDFQTAAYYDYLGDRQKSLDLYLRLEKRANSDPDLRPAPKLNIANVYYNLHRLKESRPYYQSALQELMSGADKLNDQRSIIQFIQGRLGEIDKTTSN